MKDFKPYKQIKILSTPKDFEEFVNDPNIEIVSLDVKACEQSIMFQYNFIAIACFYYKPSEETVKNYDKMKEALEYALSASDDYRNYDPFKAEAAKQLLESLK